MDKDRKDMEKNIITYYTEDIFSQRENDEYHISVRYGPGIFPGLCAGSAVVCKVYKGNAEAERG